MTGPASVKPAMADGRATGPELEDRDGPRDECGLFGIYAPGTRSRGCRTSRCYRAQHRGQESAGSAADRGGQHHHATRAGAGQPGVSPRTTSARSPASSRSGTCATRRRLERMENRSRCSARSARAAPARGPLAHNGNLTNAVELHNELLAQGSRSARPRDSEIIAALMPTHPAEARGGRDPRRAAKAEGAFSTVRDDEGPRRRLPRSAWAAPLALGRSSPPPPSPKGIPISSSVTAWRASRARSTSSARSSCVTSSRARSSR